ncbi:hypothetical protein HU200_047538 [Digitaria exilis]|uniref:Uncharacterized protein n=1 Tax=Digitaria exilis TaxID=1010633 RepID=A0A835AY71_9POAL|nr:hypothetical protein HU200_047538 [Digitaria exilis]
MAKAAAAETPPRPGPGGARSRCMEKAVAHRQSVLSLVKPRAMGAPCPRTSRKGGQCGWHLLAMDHAMKPAAASLSASSSRRWPLPPDLLSAGIMLVAAGHCPIASPRGAGCLLARCRGCAGIRCVLIVRRIQGGCRGALAPAPAAAEEVGQDDDDDDDEWVEDPVGHPLYDSGYEQWRWQPTCVAPPEPEPTCNVIRIGDGVVPFLVKLDQLPARLQQKLGADFLIFKTGEWTHTCKLKAAPNREGKPLSMDQQQQPQTYADHW